MEESSSHDAPGPGDAGGVSPGTVLKDRYRIERELGRGGIGIVYLARDALLHDKPVVVKLLLGTVGDTAWVLRKFQHEIAALARIDHPGVVGALDVGELDNRTPFIVMQYVEGVTLRTLANVGGLSLERVGRLMRMIGQALGAAHERGVIHRDLKPDNVMIQSIGPDEEYARLIDFGIASVLDPNRGTAAQTSTMVAGTVYYMAPEQLQGKPVPASDTYAMGVMAYELVTGRVPFLPDTPFQLLDLQRLGPERRPSELNRSLPRAADAAIMKALSFDAHDRFPDSRAFGDELARALEEADAGAPTGAAAIPPGATDAFHSAGATEPDLDVRPTVAADSRDAGTAPPPEPEPRSQSLLIMIAAVVALAAAGYGLWRMLQPSVVTPPVANNANIGTVEVPRAERTLSYSILVQRYRDGKPYDEPFVLPGESYFEADDQIRLTVATSQSGHLYIVNEQTGADGAASTYNTLFPSPTANAGVSKIEPGGTVEIPRTGWFKFDKLSKTVEKLWLVWSEQPIPEFEALERLANPVDRGAITDPQQAAWVARFLADSAASRPTVTRNADGKKTELRVAGNTLVQVVPLVHR
ncbi:MAG TPA: protein kinase [Blastocatellia bacterium]|nr:protein kinase [Blastocatellia bacterium]